MLRAVPLLFGVGIFLTVSFVGAVDRLNAGITKSTNIVFDTAAVIRFP